MPLNPYITHARIFAKDPHSVPMVLHLNSHFSDTYTLRCQAADDVSFRDGGLGSSKDSFEGIHQNAGAADVAVIFDPKRSE